MAPSSGQDPFVDDWTLTCLSTNLADVGVYNTVTLKVVLQDYPNIAPAYQTLSITVQHYCTTTVIKY
jgi:hypothetical protein